MHYFGIDHDTDIAHYARAEGNHDGRGTEVAGCFQHRHEGKEESHEQQCHSRPVCFYHPGDVVVEVIHRNFFQAAGSPLHKLIDLCIIARLEKDIQDRNQ